MKETFKMMDGCCSDQACGGEIEVPSPAEQEALGILRGLKEEVRDIKGRLALLETRDGSAQASEAALLRDKLGALRARWDEWEEKRKAAARERMIRLGHEKP